ncbi:MAG: DUF1549 domain-containing protein, partial [Planctomycetia bacterium]|nr:DUF1549 domain-containing protein [Planctomycetia bacterium]
MSLAGSCRWFSVLAVAACGIGTAFAQPAPVRFINEQLVAQWQQEGLTSAGRCTDLEFLRRISLDLLGRIPTLDEALAWERDVRPNRRAALVDRLLTSDEHTDHWSRLWLTWLLGDEPPEQHAKPLRAWLKEQTARNVSHRDLTLQLLTASGRSDANPAVHWLAAHLGQPFPADKVQRDGQFDMAPAVGRTAWLFLGWQLQCTECHDHAFNPDWKQKHFWGINAFFRQLEHKPGAGDAAAFELGDNPDFNRGGRICYEAPCSVFRATAATYIDGRRIPANSTQTRRQELANF